jgi:hypothetical protein
VGRDGLAQCGEIDAVCLGEQAVALFAADIGAGRADLSGIPLDERRALDKELFQTLNCI